MKAFKISVLILDPGPGKINVALLYHLLEEYESKDVLNKLLPVQCKLCAWRSAMVYKYLEKA